MRVYHTGLVHIHTMRVIKRILQRLYAGSRVKLYLVLLALLLPVLLLLSENLFRLQKNVFYYRTRPKVECRYRNAF